MAFAEELYEVRRNAISKDTCKLLASTFEIQRQAIYVANNILDNEENKFKFADSQIPKSFSAYGSHSFEGLMVHLQPLMEEMTGKTLHPAYSYARFYYNGADMAIHKDRPSCQYSTTICIENDPDFGPWEIWFKNLKGEDVPIYLEEGDLIVYKGTDLEHWRTTYNGNKQLQAFLHYVDRRGPYRDFKYDHRPVLGLQKL